jgi:hypothetical protein
MVGSNSEAAMMRIEVFDKGVGIPREELPELGIVSQPGDLYAARGYVCRTRGSSGPVQPGPSYSVDRAEPVVHGRDIAIISQPDQGTCHIMHSLSSLTSHKCNPTVMLAYPYTPRLGALALQEDPS